MWRFLALLALPFAWSWSAVPYDARVEASLSDRWRWTELDVVSGMDYRLADNGSDGAVWFGGRKELARYDGIALRRFAFEGREDELLVDFMVSRSGAVWVLTNERFMSLGDGVWTTVFERKSNSRIREGIGETAEGDVLVGIGSDLYRLRDGRVTAYRTNAQSIYSVAVDLNGKIWVSDYESATILVYSPLAAESAGLKVEHAIADPIGGHGALSLYLDLRGRVWILRTDERGRCFYYEDYERRVAMEDAGSEGGGFENFKMAEVSPDRFVFSFLHRLVERDGDSLEIYRTGAYPIVSAITAYVLKLSTDRLLIGGRESDTFSIDLSTERWATFRDLNFQCEDREGVYWFLDHAGRVVSHEPGAGRWTAYDESDGVIDTPNRAFCSSDGTLWVSGMHGGSAAVSLREDGAWRRESFYAAGLIFSHLAVIESSDGSVVFGDGTEQREGAPRAGGVVIFRKVEGRWAGTMISPPVFPGRVASIAERANDGFWVGGLGLTHCGFGSGSARPSGKGEFFQERWVDHVIVDSNNDLWAALWDNGVQRFDGEKWTAYGEAEGLGSDKATYLLADADSLWVATAAGLSRFDGASWSNWDLPQGARFSREHNSLFKSSDGALWMNHAYRSLLLDGARSERRSQEYRSIRYRKDGLAPRTWMLESDRRVPEGSQMLMKWAGADFWSDTPASELEYSWRSHGGAWSRFSRDTSVELTNVGSGSYRFEVRARDRDWNISEEPAFVSIKVIPPLWKQPWFIALEVGMVGLIVFLLNALLKAKVRHALAMEEFRLEFFTNVSHELMNPLAVIVGPLESLLGTKQSTQNRGNLSLALKSARKMQLLVRQLLQFRKLERGEMCYRPAPGELVGFLKDAVNGNAPLWEARGQSVSVESDRDYFECGFDADKLQKIIDNLLSNAIKYSPVGSPIRVRLRVGAEGGHEEALIAFEDEGEGISKHDMDLVLKPFYRVNKIRSQVEGFGIGLPLVRQLVDLWGGRMEIESPVVPGGFGTRVSVHLPVEHGHPVERIDSPEEADEPKGGKGIANTRRPKLLLVEDNGDLRHFMKSELSASYEIFEAWNGEEALELAHRVDLDLVISDVMMPVMDGFEFCRALKEDENTSHIPVILLTAKAAEESRVEGVESGADAYFAKPLNMVRLRAQVENLLEVRRKLKRRFSEQLIIEPSELTVTKSDEVALRKAIAIVEAHMEDERFDVDHFASEMGMSRATLYRKLKALTGQTPSPFIRSMRLKRAAQLLGKGGLSVSETLDRVGISDLSYFGRIFKKEFGVSPSHYRETGGSGETGE